MSIQRISGAQIPVQAPVTLAVASDKKATSPQQADTLRPAADAVTLSAAARHVTAAARSATERASSSLALNSRPSANSYVSQVRAALARGGDRSVSQIMSALGIPVSEQQQVAAALGSLK